jgi:uncharacterized CHY-type Zn-finger protein
MHCYRCHGNMIEVTIVNKRGQEYRAIVCVECGRLYSKDRIFKNGRW